MLGRFLCAKDCANRNLCAPTLHPHGALCAVAAERYVPLVHCGATFSCGHLTAVFKQYLLCFAVLLLLCWRAAVVRTTACGNPNT
jgi:hypothetical protein